MNGDFEIEATQSKRDGKTSSHNAFSVLIGGEEKKSVPLHVNEPIKAGG